MVPLFRSHGGCCSAGRDLRCQTRCFFAFFLVLTLALFVWPICFVVVARDLELQNLFDILLVRIVFLQQCTLKHIQGGLFPVFVVANKSREWRGFVIQLDAPSD